MMQQPLLRLSAALMGAALLGLAGCATPTVGPTASTDLMPTTGNTASGAVQFVQLGSDTVRVSGTIRGLAPNAELGFHIHEKGDCSSGDGMSAGGHFNPAGAPHGHAGNPGVHAGDLPSLHADATGTATFSVETRMIAVGGGVNDIVGRGLVVHRDRDDYVTQPSGNSGPRLACGVIVQR